MALAKVGRDYRWDMSHDTHDGQGDDSYTRCVSVIIPTLDEAANIPGLLMRLDQSLQQAGYFYEAIIVDDHSTDRTVAVAAHIKAQYGYPVRIITKQGRPGKSYSLMEGFAAARYDILVMIDGDLQYPPEVIPEMVHVLGRNDIIVADRRASYTTADHQRGTLSKNFDTFVGKGLFGINADLQSGLKVFRRDVYQAITLRPGRWSFDLEFLTRAKHQGFTIGNVPITFVERRGGESKVRAASVGVELLVAAMRIRIFLTLLSSIHFLMRYGIMPRSTPFVAALQRQMTQAKPEASAQAQRQEHDYYARWLTEEANLRKRRVKESVAADYTQRAMRPVMFQGKEAFPFTPLPSELSALRCFTRTQIGVLAGIGLFWLLCVVLFTISTLVATLTVVMFIYLKNLIDAFRMVARSLDNITEEHINDDIVRSLAHEDWPRYTILCPLYKEVEIVSQFVKAMTALDYPAEKLQILFLTEECDRATRDALLALRLPAHFEVVTVPDGQPRTKPRACNYGLMQATGDYIVIYDAEDIPDPAQLKKAVLTFANHTPDLACVQAKLNFYNPNQNILTRWFTIEYTLWFDLILPGMQKARMSLPLGGTSNHFRSAILRKLCAWDPFNVTEDCDLGLRLAQHHLHTVVLDSTTMEEANSRPKNWIRQRSRWIKGYLQTYLVHMRHPLSYFRTGRLREFLSLQFIIGGTPATFFVNPIMWIMVAVYVGLRPFVEDTYKLLYPAPLFYAGVLCLVFGNFLYIYTSLLACAKRKQYGLMLWTVTLPIYWAMMSIAAVMAFVQLLVKPHFWEKTQHGLHLQAQQKSKQKPVSQRNSAQHPQTAASFETSGIHPRHFD